MMNQDELPAYLSAELPEISNEMKSKAPQNIFSTVQSLVNYTKRKIKTHDLQAVKTCFMIAEKVYGTGNTIVKNAMEDVFVHSFSLLVYKCDKRERNTILSLMPISLYTVYVQQILKPGI